MRGSVRNHQHVGGGGGPVAFNENETRQANLTLMQQKRRRHLVEQLENKQQLLGQYTNSRGIGMHGSTVPQRDIELLQGQINDIRSQLSEFNNDGANPNAVHMTMMAQQQQQQQQQRHAPTNNTIQQQQQQQQQPQPMMMKALMESAFFLKSL